jgi:GH25 family lysozyme M1 (1,4-beta-N-acetylmuramidase)
MRRKLSRAGLGLLVVLTVGCLLSALGGPSVAWAAGCTPTSGQQNGVDVSQLNGSIDFGSVAASGVKFVFAKATQGNYYTDTEYSGYSAQAPAAGLAFGAYHVFDPTIDGAAQANYFLSVVNAAGGDLVPAIDVADDDKGGPNNTGGGVSTAVFTSRLQALLNTVQAALDVRPLLYDDLSQWNNDTGSDTAFSTAGYPLWIAAITASSSPTLFGGWTAWAVWQHSFTGTVPGISGSSTDEDYFDGAFNGGNLCRMTVSGAQLNVPANMSSPRISGTPAVGRTLACSEGSWTNFPGSFGYRWLRDGAVIATATSSAHTVTTADAGHRLSCRVTATNGAGGTSTTSAAVVVPAPPDTRITAHPGATITTTSKTVKVTFRFMAGGSATSFQCRLDTAAFAACRSPKTYTVSTGKHNFKVRAVGPGGTDPTPATFIFQVIRKT